MLGRVLKKRCTRELLRHGRATRQPSAAAPKVPSANHSLRSGTRRFTQRNPGGGGRPGEGARRARRSLQRSLEQPQADAHAALGYTDVLRHQLDAAASERATAVAVATAEAKAYADSQMQQELRRFQALLEQHRLFSGVRSP
jgi:hypothetical protein